MQQPFRPMKPLRPAYATRLATLPVVLSLALVSGCGSMASSSIGPQDCTSTTPNASYTGPYRGVENNLTPADIARDASCAERFKQGKYPQGFVTLFGSSRIGEESPQAEPGLRAANNRLYQDIRGFAGRWTRAYASKFPIMTGAGSGLMEAGSRGAMEAGGPSIGYTTYYGTARDNGGDARLAFWKYKDAGGASRDIVSDGLVFSSVAIRESKMIAHSAAIVIAPGGTGTEWEIFQIVETMKSGQLKPVPIFVVGDRERYWRSFEQRLDAMIAIGTVRRAEVFDLLSFVDSPDALFEGLRRALRLGDMASLPRP